MNYFVTGTDTHVGKTLVSCALLHGFAARGKRVVGMKPIAAGCNNDGQNEDVVQLRAASNVEVGYELTNPYCFLPAIAPHLAAQQAGIEIQLPLIVSAYQKLAAQAEVVIMEGVGGLCVPLNVHQDSADMLKALDLPIILVVGIRLGCLNHALLTVEAINARGLSLAAWVANVIEVDMPHWEANITALQQRIAAPLLGIVPYLLNADARIALRQLDMDRL
jgi:dethiobiotin synthetase